MSIGDAYIKVVRNIICSSRSVGQHPLLTDILVNEPIYYSARMTIICFIYFLMSIALSLGRLPVQLFQSHPLFTDALDIKSDHIFANGPQMKSDQGTLNCYLQTNPGMLKGLCEQLIMKGNPTSRVDWIIAPDSFQLLLPGQNKVDNREYLYLGGGGQWFKKLSHCPLGIMVKRMISPQTFLIIMNEFL